MITNLPVGYTSKFFCDYAYTPFLCEACINTARLTIQDLNSSFDMEMRSVSAARKAGKVVLYTGQNSDLVVTIYEAMKFYFEVCSLTFKVNAVT